MNTKILGIDYGRKKIGLSFSEGKLASPLKVLKVKSQKEAMSKIKNEVEREKIEKVIVGVSEGKMGEEIKGFVETLKEKFIKEVNKDSVRVTLTNFAIIAGLLVDVANGEPSNYHLKYALVGSILPQIPYLYKELKEKKITGESVLYSAFLPSMMHYVIEPFVNSANFVD